MTSPAMNLGPDAFHVEDGSLDDYQTLAEFHYRRGRPRVVMRVFRMIHQSPRASRWFGASPDQSRRVGVLVITRPRLACSARDRATSGRYRDLSLAQRASLINEEVRTISRVVVHPQYRGLGLAVQLVQHALARAETPYTEALAAMGRICPFFERAGMVRFDGPPSPNHARLLDALSHLGIMPHAFLFAPAPETLCEGNSEQDRSLLHTELARFHAAINRTPPREAHALPLSTLVATARLRLLSQPVYYLHRRAHD